MTAPSLPTRLAGADLTLETRGVEKRYGPDALALAGLDLEVPAGAVYVLAGPNGAGKSTAIKVLLDLVRPDRGTARVLGIRTDADPALVRAQIGYVPESAETAYGWLTVEKFLRHHAAFFEAWDWDYAELLCRRLGIPVREKMRGLSKGVSRSVVLVTALAHRPPVLLLDEPTDGLDPLAREELSGLLVDHMSASPTTLLWSTHHVHEVDRLADHVGVLRSGALVAQASREDMHRMLRSYRAEGPDGWEGPADLPGVVLRRTGAGRDLRWIVWGDERQVTERITGSGGVVRDAAPLPLDEAVVALLRWKDTA